jgi:KUP system potassium uptake protein
MQYYPKNINFAELFKYKMKNSTSNHHKLSLAGIIVSLGIIYGDIGTSPLYVMSAIIGKQMITKELIYGGLSAVFWTITLLTTIKYVMITLQADNNGEGGIFSLFALIKRKRKKKYFIWIAILGGSMLLADGIITPPISISSAIEGLIVVYPEIQTIPIVIAIIVLIFLLQQLGTSTVGKSFGPIMMIWFGMLASWGLYYILKNPGILVALSPHYAIKMLFNPKGFWLLGAIFLCTTGAEALYSDLGHVGRENIRVSWIFVKTALILNYFGQGVWLLQHEGQYLNGQNPFFAMMPKEFLLVGIGIATLAAIIASQALISGSFSLISEAVRLNIFPKIEIKYPAVTLGQIYIPIINNFLLIGCISVVLYFKKAAAMEAAYGLAITVTMLMTTLLLREYLITKRRPPLFIWVLFLTYVLIEGSFFVANLIKFTHGGYFTLIVSSLFILIMFSRWRTVKIKEDLREYVPIKDYLDQLMALSVDQSLPKFATNLVFLSTSPKETEIEYKIIYSILQKQPKRADNYWFVHVHVTKSPYTCEYKVDTIAKDDVYRITFYLGFKVEEKISQFLRIVIEDMVKKGEVNINSRYHSLKENNIAGDFRFVILEEVLSTENQLSFKDRLAIKINLWLKNITTTPEKWFNLDTNLVMVEKVPLIIKTGNKSELVRINERPNYL